MSNILKEFYKRFIIPLYIPLLSLIPFFLIISSKENSIYQKLRLITFVVGLTLVILSETIIRFISISLIQNFILFSFPVIFFISVYLYFYLKFKFNYIKR